MATTRGESALMFTLNTIEILNSRLSLVVRHCMLK